MTWNKQLLSLRPSGHMFDDPKNLDLHTGGADNPASLGNNTNAAAVADLR
jgi:hypothetical protein